MSELATEAAREPELAGPLSARKRALGFALCWLLFFFASPGVLVANGSAAMALGAVAVWAAFARAPGPRVGPGGER